MSAIEELTAAITSLTTAVNALIIAYQTPSATEAQILAAAKACNDLTTAVNDALKPANPPPTT